MAPVSFRPTPRAQCRRQSVLIILSRQLHLRFLPPPQTQSVPFAFRPGVIDTHPAHPHCSPLSVPAALTQRRHHCADYLSSRTSNTSMSEHAHSHCHSPVSRIICPAMWTKLHCQKKSVSSRSNIEIMCCSQSDIVHDPQPKPPRPGSAKVLSATAPSRVASNTIGCASSWKSSEPRCGLN